MADLQETRIRDNVIVWTLGGDTIQTSYGTNATGVIGEDAVLMIDPLIAPAYGHRLAQKLRAHTEVPVRYVVFTHHHTDHSWGAAPFEDEGAVLIGHRECRERMLAEDADLGERRGAQGCAPSNPSTPTSSSPATGRRAAPNSSPPRPRIMTRSRPS